MAAEKVISLLKNNEPNSLREVVERGTDRRAFNRSQEELFAQQNLTLEEYKQETIRLRAKIEEMSISTPETILWYTSVASGLGVIFAWLTALSLF